MTNLNNNELSARTNLHNFFHTVKAGLHNAVVSPRKRHALLVRLLLGAGTVCGNLLAVPSARFTCGGYACTGSIYLFMLGCR